MLWKLFPNRYVLLWLKRAALLIAIFFCSYLCLTYVIAPLLLTRNKKLTNAIFTFHSEPSDDELSLSGDGITSSSGQKPPHIPRIFVDKYKNSPRVSSPINGKRLDTGRFFRPYAGIDIREPMGPQNQQQQQQQGFLDALNSGDDDGAEAENATRLVDGRLVRVRQPFEPEDARATRRSSPSAPPAVPHAAGALPPCPEPSPYLTGRLKQTTLLMKNLKESDVIKAHSDLKPGGEWKPISCRPRYKVAIVVPFRDRQTHLTRLIDFLVPILKRQLIDFRFVVTEQYGGELFNKGRIMNAAFQFADERLRVDCVIFHDVDLFPQDDRNFYGCPAEPRHIGAYVNTLGYVLWYKNLVGGVIALPVDQYKQVNGYSNMYWAWGGEDDDFGLRILAHNLTIERPDPDTGRMTMLRHVKRSKTASVLIRKLLQQAASRGPNDGYNQSQWTVVKAQLRPLYHHLYVDVGAAPAGFS